MKKVFKKISILSLIFIFCCFSSCSTVTNTDVFEQPEKSETEKNSNSFSDKISTLPDYDFGGKSFRIATDSHELIMPSGSAGIVNQSLYLRNAAVEKKYNVKLVLTEESSLPTITERIKTEALAGSDYCDMIILESTKFQTLSAANLLLNIRSIPYLNINSEYYDETSLEATTFGNMTYGVCGDFTLKPAEIFAVFFNKALLNKTSLISPYQLVQDNQWDFELFLQYAEEVYSLGKVNGVKTIGYTSTLNQEKLINLFWAASGERFLRNDYGSPPEVIFNTEYTDSIISVLQNKLFRSIAYMDDDKNATNRFLSQEALFCIAPLENCKDFTGYGVDWGILPIPKFDINQENYYSYMENSYSLVGFSIGTPDEIMSGMVGAALFASSEHLSQEINTALYLNYYLNAPEDAEMLKIIMENPYYDPVEFFGQGNTAYTAVTQTLLFRTISGEDDFDQLYRQYIIMFEKYLEENF